MIVALLTIFCLPSVSAQDLNTSQQIPSRAAEQPTASDPEWTFEWRDRPRLRFGDLIRIDLRARLQGDVRRSEVPLEEHDVSRFDIARRRIGVDGSIRNIADFQIERELGAARPWRDVYVDVRRFDRVRVQAGKFKLPFSLEENTSATALDFVYRSRAATLLAPGRDRGVMVHGRLAPIRYEAGVFAHDGDNAREPKTTRVFGERTFAGRLTVEPFRSSKSALEDLEVGIAYTSSDVPEGVADLGGRTAVGHSFFAPDVWVRGQRQRIGLEGRWRQGPFSIKSEYIRLTNERLGQGIGGDDLSPLVASGWYLSGTWIVTGERKSRGPDEPRRPFLAGGFGAIELGARVESLSFRSGGVGEPSTSPRAEVILPRGDRALTFGVNWFPNRWIKIQMNVVHDSIHNAEVAQLALPSSFWSHVLRLQFSL